MKSKAFIAVACAIMVAGCGSPTVHYHTLASSMAFERASRTRADFQLRVMPVSVPPSLDQAYLAIRKGQNEIQFLDDERWASPLGNEIRTALSARLASRLNTDEVVALSTSSGEPIATLKVEIRQLDVWPESRVQLTAGWRISFSDRKDRAMSCVTQLQEPVGAQDYSELVRAQRALVLRLADVIGANLMALERAPDDDRCATSGGDAIRARYSSE